ncbi:hypothetical protein MNBD_NITROSPIRAE01-320 [hydrothermal vent metagenome]|uniref:Uncharacterized protein n=1 Tax=hydrothermal vent metagenome TaxID=652676 RepID=A0A3B1CVL0_9ZZZZ
MKKILAASLVLFIFSTTTIISPLVFAGPGSDHSHAPSAPILEAEALKTASGILTNRVKKGKMDTSWGTVKPEKIIQKTFKSEPEWVITFNNPKVENKDKQTLYIFLSLSGHFLGANFSGN